MKKEVDNTPKKKYNVNRRGFHTANMTQDMKKDQFAPKRVITLTTNVEAPSGEQGLPDLH